MKNNKQSIGSYAPPTAEIIKLSPEQAILSGSVRKAGSLSTLSYDNNSLDEDYWE
ncbi:MAG: hypothetical protein ACI4TM_09600 [Candidatus Cryptobacteroides sp.]